MNNIGRRDFLRGLLATAVATQLPALPEAKAAPLAENLAQTLGVTLNGATPYAVEIDDIGQGWYRLIARARTGGPGGTATFDARGRHPKGMAIVDRNSPMADQFIRELFDDGHAYVASEFSLTLPRRETMPHNLVLWSDDLGEDFIRKATAPVGDSNVSSLSIEAMRDAAITNVQLENVEDDFVLSMCVKFNPRATVL